MKTIEYGKEGRIGIITLNRPERMNVIGQEFLNDLDAALKDIEMDDDLGALVITGAGNVFAAGADIKEIRSLDGVVSAHKFVARVQHSFNRVEELEKPVIAAVNGLALGGGCELALVCDIRVAAETASFGLPEIKLGVLPGAGGTQRLPRLVGVGRAKELLYSGESIDAQEAFRIGLVNKVVAADSLRETALEMAGRLAARAPVALRLIKSAVNRGINMELQSALAYESRCFEMLFTTRDQKEGMQAFVEKRKPEFEGR
jgi:enoyl-CoA hydratase